MKKMILLEIFILILFTACRQSEQKNINIRKTEETNNKPKELLTAVERQKQIAEENRIDSLRFEMALQDAFKIARPVFKSDHFKKEYELQPDDSSFSIKTELLIGHLFDDDKKYFLIRRHAPWGPLETYINLYEIIEGKANKLIERRQHGYIHDTIFDVNGDNYKDFLVHWYPAVGCCRRDIYNVYLNQPEKGIFTSDYEFINPTFSAKEKIIRGIEYGHPGEAELYKYKWNGLKVDTIEFIYPDFETKNRFIKTKRNTSRFDKKGIVLKVVPKEYHSIKSYDWFLGF